MSRASCRPKGSTASLLALVASALLSCSSSDARESIQATGTPGARAQPGPSSPDTAQDANGAGDANPGGTLPAGSDEANAGLDGNTPLVPGMDAPPDGPSLADLAVREFPIPEDLPGCSPPYPHDPAVDEATGLVYYAGSNESCIGQFNPDTGEFQAWPTATPDAYPHGLVVVDGVVYFTGLQGGLIGRVDPTTGEATDIPVVAAGPHTPVLHDGAVWFTAQSSGQFGRLDLGTNEVEIMPFSSPDVGPYGIWPAPDGSLWVALFGTNRLARIDTATAPPSAEEFVLPEADSRPRRIAVDANGTVWFTDYARRALGQFEPSLPEGERVQEFPTPGGGRPYGIAIGPDGRVWYNDQDASEMVGFDQGSESVVARLDLELERPGPVRNISVDQPRRRLWLALSDVGRLAMIQF